MSTRSTTHFRNGEETHAIVYRHSDGYPEGAGTDLLRFLSDVQKHCKDTRFSDPNYLAAKYVMWLADKFARSYRMVDGKYQQVKTHKLDFLSVGVCMTDPEDIEYRYYVQCDEAKGDAPPPVRCFKIRWEGRIWDDTYQNMVDGKLLDGEEQEIPPPEEEPEEKEE